MPTTRVPEAKIQAALAVVASLKSPDGKINWSRAARETGFDAKTLKDWNSKFGASNSEIVRELETKLRTDLIDKVKAVREALMDRMLAIIPTKTDLTELVRVHRELGDDARLERGSPTEVTRVETTEHPPASDRAKAAAAEALKRQGFTN